MEKGALNTITGNKQGVWCLNYSPDGKTLLSASSDGLCKIFDAKSGKVAQMMTEHEKTRSKVSPHSIIYLNRLISRNGTQMVK